MKSIINKGDQMVKVFYKMFKLILCFLFFIAFFCFSISQYLFDYTLNPSSDYNIGHKIKQENTDKNQLWLNTNSIQKSIISYDGLKLNGYYINNNSHIYMIMVHGYRADASTVVHPAKVMNERGYNILIPELRGHGKSEGNYYGMGWIDRLDILEWIYSIMDNDEKAKIILYGISMGGATVMNVAGENPDGVVAAVEDCGYSNLWDVLLNQVDIPNSMMAICDFAVYMRTGYMISDVCPLKQIKKTKIPILFIHGDNDRFVPFSMLDQLYNSTGGPKEKLVIKGAGHAGSFETNSRLYYSTIDKFLLKYI